MRRRIPRYLEASIDALDEDGLGSARVGERHLKIRNALPGEAVTARVCSNRRGVWFAEARTPEQVAADRQPPPCPNFPRCGGCALQHLRYPAQLLHKQRQLLMLLAEHGVVPAAVRAPRFGPQFHYRFKARLGARLRDDEFLLGFREGFSSLIVRMTDCKTLALPFANALPVLRATLPRLSIAARIPQVELAAGDRDRALIVRHLDALTGHDRTLLARLGAEIATRIYLQPGGHETVHPLVAGEQRRLGYGNRDFGLYFEFEPTDFVQVNPYVNRMLVRAALLGLTAAPAAERRHRAGSGRGTVSDLFCGIGNFSLALARAGFDVRGYESSAGAVARARHNARLNGLAARAEFAAADLYDARCGEIPETEYLLLDPPRSGAGVNLGIWAGWRALRRIAYVSCNPRTFASDAALLESHGFTLQEVGIFDMFPHTAHVETLGIFVRSPRW